MIITIRGIRYIRQKDGSYHRFGTSKVVNSDSAVTSVEWVKTLPWIIKVK